MSKAHSFHIPVMGIGFTLDTPLKVAHLGIDSVISLSDDILMEKMRRFYCHKFKLPYKPISEKSEDYRAMRIKHYLNTMDKLVRKNFNELCQSLFEKKGELKRYLSLLPHHSPLKEKILKAKKMEKSKAVSYLKKILPLGSIDVNVLTKADRENYKDGKQLPPKYNNVHASLRGFAQSNLHASIVLSAGFNPRLYSYMTELKDFLPDESGTPKKKIILKVSDYRSALIQGKFLCKKGLWVDEFRIESGLNCGGHAFAKQGHLMGPILQEFKDRRAELTKVLWELYYPALRKRGIVHNEQTADFKVTAQGGVGTAAEHEFLLTKYQLDSVGWGTPFLMVPEATTVDDETLKKLAQAKEEDLYLSAVSPLGVPFNNLKNNSKDLEKERNINKGRPGSACPKGYLAFNTEFTEKGICTASRQYQHLKLKDLEKQTLPQTEYEKERKAITEKSCICVGLGTASLKVNDIERKVEGDTVSVCPGPNMAYYSKAVSLQKMVDHIYGRSNIIERKDRPHMFLKELQVYMDFLKEKKEGRFTVAKGEKAQKEIASFARQLQEGIRYYSKLSDKAVGYPDFGNELLKMAEKLEKLSSPSCS